MNFREQFYYPTDSIYVDSAATTQILKKAAEAQFTYLENGRGTLGRGVGPLSKKCEALFKNIKQKIASYYQIKSNQLILTKNATESLNLAVLNLVENLQAGDKILISSLCHNGAILPLIKMTQQKNIELIIIPHTKDYIDDVVFIDKYLNDKAVRAVVFNQIANATGIVSDVERILSTIKKHNKNRSSESKIHSLLDYSSAMLMGMPNKKLIDQADFIILSFHKVYGSSLGGVVIGRKFLDENDVQPLLYGGGMVHELHLDKDVKKSLVSDEERQFMAGVFDLSALVGTEVALQWLVENQVEHDQHIRGLTNYLYDGLININGITILGSKENRFSVVAFHHRDYSATDIGLVLAQSGIDLRVGKHCSDLFFNQKNIPEIVRISLAAYNTKEEVEQILEIIKNLPQKLWSQVSKS
ncbi:MAG: aminotransferase class V-fold PLP-dependent enzyme [Pseudomonadales bacterium]|jgi:cysteine desulfurase/selenocysteine lyase|nr:aminotransferase class V-fold PLP-dependent enzyme [Pseudomonadales bacterium]